MAGQQYNQSEVVNQCTVWLERNLMLLQSAELLRDISSDLMARLIASPDLYIIQVEMDLYSLLRKVSCTHSKTLFNCQHTVSCLFILAVS